MLIRFNISKSFSSPFISINTQQKNDDLLFMATAIDKIGLCPYNWCKF